MEAVTHDELAEAFDALRAEIRALHTDVGEPNASKPLSREQAAEYLGVHADTLYTWARENKVSYIRLGNSDRAPMRFLKSDLDTFLASQRIERVD